MEEWEEAKKTLLLYEEEPNKPPGGAIPSYQMLVNAAFARALRLIMEGMADPRYMLSQIERLTWEGHQLRMALIASGANMDEVKKMTNNEAWMTTKDPTVPDEGAHRIILEKKEGS